MLAHSVKLKSMPIQSLSELERARLQIVALCHLEHRELDFKISIPQENCKRRKSLRRRFDSFSKEKKDRDANPKAFGIPLSQVIANDRMLKQRQDALKESRLEASKLQPGTQQHSTCTFLNGTSEVTPTEAKNRAGHPACRGSTSKSHRRGGLSVDCISDLVESQSQLLEALQLSHPYELDNKRTSGRNQSKLSLNPIYQQVPRVVEDCCKHIVTYGMQTVGIFRVGSSKKRVRQLREEFDLGVDIVLDEEHSVHDVAALLKEFLRDIPDPLLPRELYSAFLHTNSLKASDQLPYLQLLLYLLPPSNCDTLLRLLTLLHTVQSYSQDSFGPEDHKVLGNKMTATNLAVIFGPNLLQKERGSERDLNPHMGIEDSAAVISVTLQLIQNYKHLFMVSVELQQEVLMSLLQTDPEIIVYLLRRKLSGSNPTAEIDSGGRKATKASLDSVGLSSGDVSPMEAPPILFPEVKAGGHLNSEVIFNALRLNQIRKRISENSPAKSIAKIRQFHSHHNLLSLARPTPRSPVEDGARQQYLWQEEPGSGNAERTILFTLGEDPCGEHTLPLKENNHSWRRQRMVSTPEDSKPHSTHFWDFFTRRVPSSENLL